jgi:hypothetical protein
VQSIRIRRAATPAGILRRVFFLKRLQFLQKSILPLPFPLNLDLLIPLERREQR